MPRCSASISIDNVASDGLNARQMPSGVLASAPEDRLQLTHHPLAPVGTGHSLTGPHWPPQAEQPIEERATPAKPRRSLSESLSLSGRFAGEKLGLRDGNSDRRGKLEGVLKLMVADFDEWSQGAKVEDTARTFLIRCRGHLGKLEKLRTEHNFIRNPRGSKAVATEAGLKQSHEADDFLADVACAKKKVGEWITQAVLETDMSLRDDCAGRLAQFRQQYGTAQQEAAASQLGDFSLAMEKLKYLSEHSKKGLRQEISNVQEVLNGR